MPRQQQTHLLKLVFALFLWLSSATFVAAYQDDPFGDPFGGNDAGAKKQDDDPFNPGAGKPAVGTPATGKGAKVDLPKTEDKVVLAIRETNPATPSEFLQALRIMFDTQNFDEAKSYLGKLEAANVDDATAFALVNEIGSDFIVRLIRSEKMAPKGAAFGRSLLAASSRHLRSDAQLQIYLNDLGSSSPTKRNSAARGFRLAGISGLAHLIKNVGAADESVRRHYEVAAALIGNPIVKPLESVLETGDDTQKSFALSVLGLANSQKSIPLMLGPMFDPASSSVVKASARKAFTRMLGGAPEENESKRFLRRKLFELIDGATPFNVDPSGYTEFWNWSTDGKFVTSQIKPEMASVLMMERLGKALYSIDPQDPQSERLFLATQLTALKTLSNKPVPEVIEKSSLSAVSAKKWLEVLDVCLEKDLLAGAAGAAEIIGKIGDSSILETSRFSPLVRAMQRGDRHLRYSCTEAIINLDPQKAFPGANHFIDSAVFFAGTKGEKRVLVAHPKVSEGQNLIGSLLQRGFSANAATTGRELFRMATLDPDVEFMLISDAISRPSLGELITQLRSHPSLARIPIGILSQKMNQAKNERIANSDPLTLAIKQPYRISFRVEQMLPADNRELNNAIITWSVLSDLLEQALEQGNRSVSIQMLETMRAAYNDDLSKLAVDNSAIVEAMKNSDQAIKSRASKLFLRVTGEKPLYEKPIEQPTTSGRVLIVHPQAADILPLREKLEEVGYTVGVAATVDAAITAIPNLEKLKFVIGSKEFGGLAENELRKALAKKFRLNPVPITYVSRADSYRETPVARPIFDTQLAQIQRLKQSETSSPQQRVSRAKTCLQFLEKVITDRKTYGYTDPLRHEKRIINALQNRALTIEALSLLGELATPTAQQAIVDLASESTRSPAERQAALDALATAIQKRGILLTKAAILEQYDRYNKSETLDSQTQQILGAILDVIESSQKGK